MLKLSIRLSLYLESQANRKVNKFLSSSTQLAIIVYGYVESLMCGFEYIQLFV